MVLIIIRTPWPISKGFGLSLFACLCLLASMLHARASLSCSRLCHAWCPWQVCGCVVTSNTSEALFGCNHLGCIALMPVASCIPFPFSVPCDDMLVCATHWLSMYLYKLAYMSMHESCLLVCRPYFNTMKLWTFDPNLHLSLTDTTFCLLSCLFAFLLSYFFDCHVYYAYLLYASFICSLHLFLPLLVCRFLVFAFACTHMERRRMELRHGLSSASKKGEDASMWI